MRVRDEVEEETSLKTLGTVSLDQTSSSFVSVAVDVLSSIVCFCPQLARDRFYAPAIFSLFFSFFNEV